MDALKEFWNRELFTVKGVHVTIGSVVIVIAVVYLYRRFVK